MAGNYSLPFIQPFCIYFGFTENSPAPISRSPLSGILYCPHADVFFPEYNDGTWEVETRQERAETDDTPAYAYVDYVRKNKKKNKKLK